MKKISLANYNLDQTLIGGQSFSWDKVDGEYLGYLKDGVVKLSPIADGNYQVTIYGGDVNYDIDYYLNLNNDYDQILKLISVDPHVKQAIQEFPGLRLLNQDFETTLISFIISANSNIKAIRTKIRRLSSLIGNKIEINERNFYMFPTAQAINEAEIELLLSVGLGYRAEYVKAAAKLLVEDPELEVRLRALSDDELHIELKKLPGVGDKVAHCVAVFGLQRENLFPLDLWGRRIGSDLYQIDPKTPYKIMHKEIVDKFNGYASYASQFLFEWYRKNYIQKSG